MKQTAVAIIDPDMDEECIVNVCSELAKITKLLACIPTRARVNPSMLSEPHTNDNHITVVITTPFALKDYSSMVGQPGIAFFVFNCS
jgi:hypothetical protein